MTNKLVVIINSLKVPKVKKYFTIWNEISCTKSQLPPEPLIRGLPPPDPRSLCRAKNKTKHKEKYMNMLNLRSGNFTNSAVLSSKCLFPCISDQCLKSGFTLDDAKSLICFQTTDAETLSRCLWNSDPSGTAGTAWTIFFYFHVVLAATSTGDETSIPSITLPVTIALHFYDDVFH